MYLELLGAGLAGNLLKGYVVLRGYRISILEDKVKGPLKTIFSLSLYIELSTSMIVGSEGLFAPRCHLVDLVHHGIVRAP